jgi:hypothetical protein
MKHSKTTHVPKWVKILCDGNREHLKIMVEALASAEYHKLHSKKDKKTNEAA